MSDLDKTALREELVARLLAEHETVAAAQRLSSEGVTHADAKADGIKDMRATEASYIARGQAMRVEALAADIAQVRAMKIRSFSEGDAVALTAVVAVEDEDGRQRVVFLAPAGGGEVLADGRVHVVTPRSPLGRALVGTRLGDTVELVRGGRAEELAIVAVD